MIDNIIHEIRKGSQKGRAKMIVIERKEFY